MRGQTRERLRSGALWTSVALLAAGQIDFLRGRGPLRFSAPRTVYSNGHPAQRSAEPYLLFLRDVAAALPAGASVLVRGEPPPDAPIAFAYTAVGQLPRQLVVADAVEGPVGSGQAEYRACFGGPCAEGGYREVRRFAAGTLAKRAD